MLTRHGDFIMLGGKFPRLAKKQAGARLKEIKKLLLGCNFTSFLIEHPEIVPIPVAVGQFQGQQEIPAWWPPELTAAFAAARATPQPVCVVAGVATATPPKRGYSHRVPTRPFRRIDLNSINR